MKPMRSMYYEVLFRFMYIKKYFNYIITVYIIIVWGLKLCAEANMQCAVANQRVFKLINLSYRLTV